MQPVNVVTAGALIRNRVYPSQGINDIVTYPATASAHQVSCSSIVKGNHKSPNPWSYHVSNRTNGPLFATYKNVATGDMDVWSGNYVGVTEQLATWLNSDMATADAMAYADLVENIRGGTDLSVDAFQMRQTVGTPRQLLDLVQNAKRIRRLVGVNRLTKPMKLVGNAWLLWTYGIKPTMQSIHDAVAFRKSYYGDTVKVFTGRGVVKTSKTIIVPNWPDSGGWTSKCEIQTSARVLYKVRMKIPDTPQTSAARLSSLNPASIAWELLPWSFVIDWFYNIGDYLRGLETSLVFGRYFVDGFKTTSFVSQSEQTATRPGIPPAGVVWTGKYLANGVNKGMNRVILSSYPNVPVPKLQTQLGSGRMLNAAALLTTFLR